MSLKIVSKAMTACQSVCKMTSNFKKIVHICVNNGWLTHDPFVGFKMAKREIERPFLVQEELDAIIEKDFPIQRIDQVRDIFVFCCYTGLSYADVEKLTTEDITTGIDGEKWIWTARQKTDTANLPAANSRDKSLKVSTRRYHLPLSL